MLILVIWYMNTIHFSQLHIRCLLQRRIVPQPAAYQSGTNHPGKTCDRRGAAVPLSQWIPGVQVPVRLVTITLQGIHWAMQAFFAKNLCSMFRKAVNQWVIKSTIQSFSPYCTYVSKLINQSVFVLVSVGYKSAIYNSLFARQPMFTVL